MAVAQGQRGDLGEGVEKHVAVHVHLVVAETLVVVHEEGHRLARLQRKNYHRKHFRETLYRNIAEIYNLTTNYKPLYIYI